MKSMNEHQNMKCPSFSDAFYGTCTVGERGQIVIPVEARAEIGFQCRRQGRDHAPPRPYRFDDVQDRCNERVSGRVLGRTCANRRCGGRELTEIGRVISAVFAMFQGNAAPPSGPLTLDQAVSIAQTQAFAIRLQETAIEKQRQRVNEARGNLGPQIALGANYTRYDQEITSSLGQANRRSSFSLSTRRRRPGPLPGR